MLELASQASDSLRTLTVIRRNDTDGRPARSKVPAVQGLSCLARFLFVNFSSARKKYPLTLTLLDPLDCKARGGALAVTAGKNRWPIQSNKVAALSGVSVRTLHFYDESGLLKPAYVGANGYRFYEEPQLLTLQQILFYRELGFELKRINEILGRADFEKVAALQSHRKVLQENLVQTRRLIETIDKTIQHLNGVKKMESKEMFAGFRVGAGDDRFA